MGKKQDLLLPETRTFIILTPDTPGGPGPGAVTDGGTPTVPGGGPENGTAVAETVPQ